MKKILSLGGNYFQMTAVKAAKRLGYYVIDADYLPNNPAHQYADEYYNISTLDKEEILKLAEKRHVDGIISYASDVSAPTAAYVAEKLGLPTNPYNSVYMMTRKDLFHPFLRENGFYVPQNKPIHNIEEAYECFETMGKNVLLKPVIGSGSKGITHITNELEIEKAYNEAEKYSRGNGMAMEQFVIRKKYQIAGDAFLVDGKIAFFGLANEHFNNRCNPLVPVGESFPVDLDEKKIEKAKLEIQKALTLLNVKNGAINLDFMFDENDNIFIIELGPRNGGNLITDAIKMSTGVDLAEYTVKAAVGDDISDLEDSQFNRIISSYIWHSEKDTVFKKLSISKELSDKIILSDLFIKEGENVSRYINGSFGLGAALIEYSNKEEMLYMMDNMNQYYKID